MTVKELKEILNTAENENMPVTCSYYSEEINGYYFKESEGKKKLVLTDLYVQPRIVSEK